MQFVKIYVFTGLIYDYYFVKQSSGSWGAWIDYLVKSMLAIQKDAKVCNNTTPTFIHLLFFIFLLLFMYVHLVIQTQYTYDI